MLTQVQPVLIFFFISCHRLDSTGRRGWNEGPLSLLPHSVACALQRFEKPRPDNEARKQHHVRPSFEWSIVRPTNGHHRAISSRDGPKYGGLQEEEVWFGSVFQFTFSFNTFVKVQMTEWTKFNHWNQMIWIMCRYDLDSNLITIFISIVRAMVKSQAKNSLKFNYYICDKKRFQCCYNGFNAHWIVYNSAEDLRWKSMEKKLNSVI